MSMTMRIAIGGNRQIHAQAAIVSSNNIITSLWKLRLRISIIKVTILHKPNVHL